MGLRFPEMEGKTILKGTQQSFLVSLSRASWISDIHADVNSIVCDNALGSLLLGVFVRIPVFLYDLTSWESFK